MIPNHTCLYKNFDENLNFYSIYRILKSTIRQCAGTYEISASQFDLVYTQALTNTVLVIQFV